MAITPAYSLNNVSIETVTVTEQRLADLIDMGVADGDVIDSSTLTTDDQRDILSYLAQREYWDGVKAGTYPNPNNFTTAEIDIILDDLKDLLDVVTKTSSSSGPYADEGYDANNFDLSSQSSESSDSSG